MKISMSEQNTGIADRRLVNQQIPLDYLVATLYLRA